MKMLFASFFKVGALTFGGGYSMLPILQREIVEKRGMATHEEIMDYHAVAQCLPGIIAVNTAILIGYKVRKRAGGICAAFGVIVPSVIIILLIAAFLQNFLEYEIVRKAFWGIRIVVSALIAQAIIKLWKTAMKSVWSYVFYCSALFVSLFTPVPTAMIVVAAVAVGVCGGLFSERKGGKSL